MKPITISRNLLQKVTNQASPTPRCYRDTQDLAATRNHQKARETGDGGSKMAVVSKHSTGQDDNARVIRRRQHLIWKQSEASRCVAPHETFLIELTDHVVHGLISRVVLSCECVPCRCRCRDASTWTAFLLLFPRLELNIWSTRALHVARGCGCLFCLVWSDWIRVLSFQHVPTIPFGIHSVIESVIESWSVTPPILRPCIAIVVWAQSEESRCARILTTCHAVHTKPIFTALMTLCVS